MVNSDLKKDSLHQSLRSLNDFKKHYEHTVKSEFGVAAIEMEIIGVLAQKGQMRMKDVARQFGLKFSTFTSIVDKAENKGLIQRINSKEDRRVVFLAPTKMGNTLFDRYQVYVNAAAQNIASQLPERALVEFAEGLEAIKMILDPPQSKDG